MREFGEHPLLPWGYLFLRGSDPFRNPRLDSDCTITLSFTDTVLGEQHFAQVLQGEAWRRYSFSFLCGLRALRSSC